MQQNIAEELLSRVFPTPDGVSDREATEEPPTPAPHRHVIHQQAQVPHKLQANVSLRELKIWHSAWMDYEKLLHFQEQTSRTQLAYFQSCFSLEMHGTQAHAIGIGEDDDTIPVKKILEYLNVHLQCSRNITLKRDI